MRCATAALSVAKQEDAEEPVLCSLSDLALVKRRARIRRELYEAFARRQLRVAYQPVVELSTRSVVGFEALSRWSLPDGLQVSPPEFVSVAEEIGLIKDLGRWVLTEAIHAISSLDPEAGRPLAIAVNLSPRQFSDPHLISELTRILSATGFDPSRISLEITERLAVDDDRAGKTIRALRDLGCHVGLDDFGTGQSCLSYLRLLPVDFVKVDGSFVAQLGKDARADRLVSTIAAMARDLGLETVVEGVETEAQYQHAASAGCTYGQGYLFGKPVFQSELTSVP